MELFKLWAQAYPAGCLYLDQVLCKVMNKVTLETLSLVEKCM